MTEHGAVGGARTCLSEASPAAQCEEPTFYLARSVQRALFLVAFSLAAQRKRTYKYYFMKLPEHFEQTTAPLMGSQRWQRFRDSLSEERPVSIHLNPTKATHMNIHPEILDAQVPWCPNGYYLRERPAFTFDPLWHAGLYYVQEAASMFICEVIRQHITQPVTALDLCAAPGGKSLLLRETLPQDSLLFSNEPMRHRANILVENIHL